MLYGTKRIEKLSMLKAKDILQSNKKERAQKIKAEAKKLTAPTTLGKLITPYKYGFAMRQFTEDYININIELDKNLMRGSVLKKENLEIALKARIEDYLVGAMKQTSAERVSIADMIAKPTNAYEMSGASELAFANRVTRNLSTTMGNLWEKLADISPYAINPDLEFGIKIRGIDLIAKNMQNNLVEFIQLKTTKNTLSGSQSGRANDELLLHPNPVFAAAFDVNQNWTYKNDENIIRICGKEFWARIGMDYDLVFQIVTNTIRQLEDEFVKALAK